jgi:hypothetical protein
LRTARPQSACGWCKDKWGVSWQITPRVLMEAMAAGGDEAKRAFEAMMGMKKMPRSRRRGAAGRLGSSRPASYHARRHGGVCRSALLSLLRVKS